MQETEPKQKAFPNTFQSILLSLSLIISMVLLSPITMKMVEILGNDLAMLFGYVLVSVVPLSLGFYFKKKIEGEVKLNLKIINPKTIPVIIICAVILLFGIISPLSGFAPLDEATKEMFLQMMQEDGIGMFLSMVIAAPILEELLFRGIILDGLLKQHSPALAIFISTMLFGIVHLNPQQFIAALFLGGFMGWVYYRTGSFLACMIIHCAANLSAFITYRIIDVEKFINLNPIDYYGGLLNLSLIFGVAIILVLLCIYFLDKEY